MFWCPSSAENAAIDTAVTVTAVDFLRRVFASLFPPLSVFLSFIVYLLIYLLVTTHPLKSEQGTVAAMNIMSSFHCYLFLLCYNPSMTLFSPIFTDYERCEHESAGQMGTCLLKCKTLRTDSLNQEVMLSVGAL